MAGLASAATAGKHSINLRGVRKNILFFNNRRGRLTRNAGLVAGFSFFGSLSLGRRAFFKGKIDDRYGVFLKQSLRDKNGCNGRRMDDQRHDNTRKTTPSHRDVSVWSPTLRNPRFFTMSSTFTNDWSVSVLSARMSRGVFRSISISRPQPSAAQSTAMEWK